MQTQTFIPPDVTFQTDNAPFIPRAGDNILWKGGGLFTAILSGMLALKDKSWRSRTWKPWHTGFVVKVLDSGEIVTFQAVNLFEGVCAVTYGSLADMGDCRLYHWLNNPDPAEIQMYIDEWNGWPYDVMAYVWVIVTVLFNQNWSISDKKLMCWENLSNFDRFMGRELQPCYEEPLISKMMNALEGIKNQEATMKPVLSTLPTPPGGTP